MPPHNLKGARDSYQRRFDELVRRGKIKRADLESPGSEASQIQERLTQLKRDVMPPLLSEAKADTANNGLNIVKAYLDGFEA